MGAPILRSEPPRLRGAVVRISSPAYRLLAFSALSLVLLVYTAYHFYKPAAPLLTTAQLSRFEADLERCSILEQPPYWKRLRTTAKGRVNPRYKTDEDGGITVLQNATLWDGEKWVGAVDVVLEKGTISEIVSVGSAGSPRKDSKVQYVNVGGKVVTPGLVDMHSHSGASTNPDLPSTDDTNEATAPLTPYARILDAIKPDDEAIPMIASGGVTTSLILPGSANIMGGEAFAIKNVAPEDNLVESMLIESPRAANRTRWMKMACGENPKRLYKHTRMGLAWKLRQHLAEAKEVLASQQSWCARAMSKDPNVRYRAAVEGIGSAKQLEYELTSAMLAGQVRTNVHCYETVDLETMLRHTHEFGYRITAFHHALSSWKVADTLAKEGYPITQAIFAEHSLFKKEAYSNNLYAGKILHDAGVPVAYKSDHPVLNAKHLIQQPQVAYAFHLPEDVALSSVTSTPARALGLDDRIGYVREGYDADLVIWSSHPLEVGATPLQVFIDGTALYNFEEVAKTLPSLTAGASTAPPPVRALNETQTEVLRNTFSEISSSKDALLVVRGIRKSLAPNHQVNSAYEALTLVANSTNILCLSTSCPLSSYNQPLREITLSNGILTSPIYAVSHSLGLSEIEAEPSTRDGETPDVSALDSKNVIFAHYGIHFGSKILRRAFDGGATKAITPPLHGGGLLRGVSVGFSTGAGDPLSGIWQEEVALHVVVGQSGKGKSEATISQEIGHLKEILEAGEGPVYSKARKGEMRVVVHASNRDDIAQIIKLQRAYPDAKFVIYGGTEAWLVASDLAAASIPVILSPWRCAPLDWESRRCLIGPPLTESPVNILHDAGVKIALAQLEDDLTRDLPAEAAWVGKYLGLNDEESFKLVSQNIVEIMGLGEMDEIVLWEGDPLSGAGVVVGVLGA